MPDLRTTEYEDADDSSKRARRKELRAALIERLRSENAVPGIEIGARAPDFELPNQFGTLVSFKSRLGQGPIILVFYRGSWCPICNTHIRTLQQSLAEFERLGAVLLAITPQRPNLSTRFADDLYVGFDVLSDTTQSTITDYRLRFQVPNELAAHSAELGHPLDEQNADGSQFLPVPATFVLDQAGIVRARHVDPNYRHRMAPADIIAAIKSITT